MLAHDFLRNGETEATSAWKPRDPNAKIMGPSADRWDQNYMRDFLTYAKNNNCLPDIVSWHELGLPEGNYSDTPRPGPAWVFRSAPSASTSTACKSRRESREA
jgi:hypothetical protein